MKENVNKLDAPSKRNLKVGIILLLVFFGLWYIEPVSNFVIRTYAVLRPILLGFAIAFVINLPMNFFQEKVFGRIIDPLKHRKTVLVLSLILSWLIFFVGITVIILVVIPEIINAVETAIVNIPQFIKSLEEFTRQFPPINKLVLEAEQYVSEFDVNWAANKVTDYITGEGSDIINSASNIISSVSSTLIAIVMGFIFSIYVSINKKNLKLNSNRILYANFNEERADQINYVFKLTYDAFSRFLESRLLSCLILGILNFIGMKILRLPYAGMISALVGVLDIVPYFGPIIAAAFGMIMIFIISPIQAVIFIVFLVILQQVQENVIYPLFIGKQVGLPAIWIFVSVFLGGRLFGILGMIIFMPIATVLYTLLEDNTIKNLKENNMDRITVAEKAQKSFEEMREEKQNDNF